MPSIQSEIAVSLYNNTEKLRRYTQKTEGCRVQYPVCKKIEKVRVLLYVLGQRSGTEYKRHPNMTS